MRLGLVLLTMARAPKLPYRFRGKYRKVKKPSLDDLFKMKQDFQREEQNMMILRHPYLTISQERCSKKTKENGFLKKVTEYKRSKFEKEITIADHLAHLRITEAWD
ncbi:hypothetical protein EAG_07547 [Camponotus floridanus]|uniref:Ribosomal protein 63, mitochondrial n=1 Tax=Camponotus floridanus TaxID=104421 RepID=E2A430_CAMFO|nr:hypothetical protein EAG_07547 [Camponotus floridanus]